MRFRPLVLCYHAASAEWGDELSVPPAALLRQVRLLLRAGLRPVRALDTVDNPSRTLHVTFDDAYRSVEATLPGLQALGVPVTVFACTALADGGRALDVVEMRGRADSKSHELLTMPWGTLAELAERGVEIGSHTATHPHLPLLGDDELRRELAGSREALEDHLRRRCSAIAYPFGHQDARVRAAARAAGYSVAFSLDPTPGLDRFALPRIDVYRRDSLPRFAAKCSPPGRRLVALRAARRS